MSVNLEQKLSLNSFFAQCNQIPMFSSSLAGGMTKRFGAEYFRSSGLEDPVKNIKTSLSQYFTFQNT